MKRVEKGWGHEEIIHNADGYCGKILHFLKGKKCSYHYHLKKTETFYCVGRVVVRHGFSDDLKSASETILSTGDVFHVPVGLRHQMEAFEDSQLFEFSTLDFPDDSLRIVLGD
jgi:mannose-6-phosphate isomerase-like protein (cupin superfamily)